MIVNLDNQQYVISWQHNMLGKGKKEKGRWTRCFIRLFEANSPIIAEGIVYCSKKEPVYHKNKGRKEALRDLLLNRGLNLAKETRTYVWSTYRIMRHGIMI